MFTVTIQENSDGRFGHIGAVSSLMSSIVGSESSVSLCLLHKFDRFPFGADGPMVRRAPSGVGTETGL